MDDDFRSSSDKFLKFLILKISKIRQVSISLVKIHLFSEEK